MALYSMGKIPIFGPVEKIPIKDICLDPDNPRLGNGPKGKRWNQENLLKHYSNEYKYRLADLKASIQEEGVLEPIYVIRAPKNHPCKYIVKDGSRRLVVSKQLTEEQEKDNIEPPKGVRWDAIPAQIYKKGTKDSEIRLHLSDMQKVNYYDIHKMIERDWRVEYEDIWSKIWKEKPSIQFDKIRELDSDFTREDLEKIAVKLGLGKPPKKMSIELIKLIIKYRLEFGN